MKTPGKSRNDRKRGDEASGAAAPGERSERDTMTAGSGAARPIENVEFPSWEQWMGIAAPDSLREVRRQEVVLRYSMNGFDWDIHGTLVTPVTGMKEHKFLLTHGGAGSEAEVLETPDGRPGLAVVLAQQGYETLAVSYVGHYPQGGVWTASTAERMPEYLIGQALPSDEVLHRNLVCSFDVQVEGMARLADEVFDGKKIVAFGHSTGGPMVVALQEFLKRNRVVGIVGWGSGEPTIWAREWDIWFGRPRPRLALDNIARRTPDWFRSTGYEDARDLTPWGGAPEYNLWADRHKSQFKTALCENQLFGALDLLLEFADATGLPAESFVGYLHDPDPFWLAETGIFLLVGENDSRLFTPGPRPDLNRQIFATQKYAVRARRALTRVVPRFGHFGFVGLHNEKIAYAWIDALESGFFERGGPERSRRPMQSLLQAA